MKRITFDIETGAAANATDFAPEFKAPSNYKDPDKIAEHIAGQKEAFLERAALDPITGCIAAFSFAYDNDKPTVAFNVDLVPKEHGFYSIPENELISLSVDLFEKAVAGNIPLIGFNSKAFDLMFLFRRAFILGIPVPEAVRRLASDRYNANSIDLLQVWLCGARDYTGQSLARICKACGIGEKSDDGKYFAEIAKVDVKRAADYALHDIELTMKLADRLLA